MLDGGWHTDPPEDGRRLAGLSSLRKKVKILGPVEAVTFVKEKLDVGLNDEPADAVVLDGSEPLVAVDFPKLENEKEGADAVAFGNEKLGAEAAEEVTELALEALRNEIPGAEDAAGGVVIELEIEVDDDAVVILVLQVAPAKLEKEGVTEEEDDPNKVGKDGDAADDEKEVIGGERETPNDVEEKLGVDVAEEDDDPNKPVEKRELTVVLDPNKPDPVNGDGDDVPNNVPVEAAVEAPKPKAGVEDDEDASANPNEGVDDADDEDALNKGVEDVDELNIEEDEVGFEIENGDGDEDDANENSDGDEDDNDEVKVDKLEEKVKPDIVDV
ncbi:hypothetical protein L2E82_36982 [Cichorium intybus]|uniref:Uncharacterized protein n=1 Tax=Cichorium intybus TaxID=13427 RepID=A0ACB9ADQ4_CICIN|nr:hypothetical protein L2E82_36982 [Cichorium intybus]